VIAGKTCRCLEPTWPSSNLIEPELRAAAFGRFDPHTFLGARNQAILALLSDCGVRRDELCILKDADIDLTDMQVSVYDLKTEQTRWRLVQSSEETAAVLTNYVRLRERYLARRWWQFGDVPAT
jgi:integrase